MAAITSFVRFISFSLFGHTNVTFAHVNVAVGRRKTFNELALT